MFYAAMGYVHALFERRARAIRALAGDEEGQGTVEYVGLILLVSLLMVGMVAAMKGFNRQISKGGNYSVSRTETPRYPQHLRDGDCYRRNGPSSWPDLALERAPAV